MPYRSELKRPDLKGQFPCSVCGKIFCHSSSLSRHRMQAHFKSYQCMQCNQEISSNETLRSHMMRTHQIARMFMCRCCNWAFPDKTSLHLHTTSLAKTGKPGEVAVLARSFAEGDDVSHLDLHNTPSSSPPEARDSVSPAEPKPAISHLPNSNSLSSLPPAMQLMALSNPLLQGQVNLQALLSHLDMLKRNQERVTSERVAEELPSRSSSNDFVANWMANNPFSFNAKEPKEMKSEPPRNIDMNNRKRRSLTPDDQPVKLMKTEPTEMPASPSKFFSDGGSSSLNASLDTPSKSNGELRKNKRKSRKPQQLTPSGMNLAALAFDSPVINTEFEKKNSESECGMSEQNQLSPAVSDSHTSGSGNETVEGKKEDKAVEYAERLQAIRKWISKFFEVMSHSNLDQKRQAMLEIVSEIQQQCDV